MVIFASKQIVFLAQTNCFYSGRKTMAVKRMGPVIGEQFLPLYKGSTFDCKVQSTKNRVMPNEADSGEEDTEIWKLQEKPRCCLSP